MKNEDSDHADGEQGAEDDALDGVLGFALHAPIIACTSSPVKLKSCGKRRVYGSHTRAPPAYMEHHVLHIEGLLPSWDSYIKKQLYNIQ